MDMSNLVGLDFETYSAAPLPKVGLKKYVADPTFKVTLAGVANTHGTTHAAFPERDTVAAMIDGATVVAHNAGFERAVLNHWDIDVPVLDSAVVAAMSGADRHLAGAARQLLNIPKLDEDRSLLRLFAMPSQEQIDRGDLEFDMRLPRDNPAKWDQFIEYCERDAELSRLIFIKYMASFDMTLFGREMKYAELTLRMNEIGWPVDVASAGIMLEQYRMNLDEIQDDFAKRMDPDLNLFSHDQVKKWCADRGIRSASFDKQNVERLLARLRRKLGSGTGWKKDWDDVLFLLETKQALGGTSMKKLEAILDTQHNGRLYDQYFHVGAAQSWRTTGRGVQMQNLPRLPENPKDMRELSMGKHWTNDEIGENLRQVFRASRPDGLLFVADFASIESRGLAYLAGEEWKLDAYRQGTDVYKALAAKVNNIPDVSTVTKEQRTFGKVGELSCGYGAGPGAVRDFAAKMHVELTEGEAKQLVYDWRDADPQTVKLWKRLDEGLHEVVANHSGRFVVPLAGRMSVVFRQIDTPGSLYDQDSDVQSVAMNLYMGARLILTRVFHGCHLRGNNVGYYKPSSLKGGLPWKRKYVDPKTKMTRYYELYGGKLAGILTQSLCREIFFECLYDLSIRLEDYPNCQIIGQFHDEVIVEWWPPGTDGVTEHELVKHLEASMGKSAILPDLPMAVEVKSASRYVK